MHTHIHFSSMNAPDGLPRIVIVDHYDSYTRNLIPLIASCFDPPPDPELLARRVTVIPHTLPVLSPLAFRERLLTHVDALILSPGPGTSDNEVDFGQAAALLQSPELEHIPILGVCLGHQGIATTAGAKIVQLAAPFHGRTRELIMDSNSLSENGQKSIVSGIAEGTAVICYNSLCVDESTLPSTLRVVARSRLSPNETMVQAIEHTKRPLYGVQFHPESIETNGGTLVMQNFLHNVAHFWARHDQARVEAWKDAMHTCLPPDIVALGSACLALGKQIHVPRRRWRVFEKALTSCTSLPDKLAYDAPALFEKLFRRDEPGAVWLDSANPRDPQSHVSIQSRATCIMTYDMDGVLRVHQPNVVRRIDMHPHQTLWDWMEDAQRTMQAQVHPMSPNAHTQFRTGFVGYWGYELKDESLGLASLSSKRYEPHSGTGFDRTKLPAAQWAFCDHALCLDHATNTWMAYALVDEGGDTCGPLAELETHGVRLGMPAAEAEAWLTQAQRAVDSLQRMADVPPASLKVHTVDDAEVYKDRIEACRRYIASGESYELCLTTQFEGALPFSPSYASYFSLYCALRQKNPAPFSAYMELVSSDGSTPQAILSTSPERFLTVSDAGAVEMRPIKGTKVRPGWGEDESDWFEKARHDASMQAYMVAEDESRKQALHMDPKERAENLMIADLIRADLQAVCYPGSVAVPRLIALETYETVHQLVTSVTGQLRPGIGCVEAAKRCFPPGSMTGAPKRRSVELIESLERTSHAPQGTTRRRGVYSGALGFMGVDGASNLSVVIRTVTVQNDHALVGAGGAVTFLSTLDGEWSEVMTKLGSVAALA